MDQWGSERSAKERRDEGRDLISKKEALEQTGISYGQFYRWKRKGLIPERWFIHKSTFTGQETFLPRELILERIETIKRLKDQYSLEEVADLLSPEPSKQVFDPDELPQRGWIARDVIEHYNALTGHSGPYRFWDVFLMEILEKLRRLEVEREAIDLALATLRRDAPELSEGGRPWTLCLVRNPQGARFCCVTPGAEVVFDPQSSVIAQIDLNRALEGTKMKLRETREG